MARTNGIVVFDNESGSFSNTKTTYVSTFIMHAEFNLVTYVLFPYNNFVQSKIPILSTLYHVDCKNLVAPAELLLGR